MFMRPLLATATLFALMVVLFASVSASGFH